MNRNNRIIYDQTGNIWLQTGEATGDIQEWSKITELNFLDVEFGSIDYSKQYKSSYKRTNHQRHRSHFNR